MIDFELECIGFHGMSWISDVSFFWDLMEFQCSFFLFSIGI